MADSQNANEHCHSRRINPYKLFNGSFVPEWLMTTQIVSSHAKLVYSRLCRYAGNDGKCYPKLEDLAKEVGLPLSTMRRALSELLEQGMMESVRRGLGLANDYYFLWHPLMDSEMDNPDCPPVDNLDCSLVNNQECSPVDNPISRESDKRIRQDNTPLSPKGEKWELDEKFMAIYSLYQKANPIRCDVDEAYRVWRSPTHRMIIYANEIAAALPAFMSSSEWKKDGGKMVPTFSRFLKDGIWRNPPRVTTGNPDLPPPEELF